MQSTDLLYLGRSPYGTTDDFAIEWGDMQASITAVDTITTGVWQGTVVGITYGGTGVSAVTTTPTASSWAAWDSDSNFSSNNFLAGFTATVTAAGTTTLTVASTQIQEFTGSTTQTCTLPVVSTLALGFPFRIINNSSGEVTVNSSGGNAIQVMAADTTLFLTCIALTGTGAASWNANYTGDNAGVLSITGTADQIIASASTGAITLSTPQDIATTSSPIFTSITGGNIQVSGNSIESIDTNGDVNLTPDGTGQVTITNDALINTLTAGLGGGADSTNTVFGYAALASASSAVRCIAIGYNALNANVSGIQNVAIGHQCLAALTSGNGNTAIGRNCVSSTTGVTATTAVGASCLDGSNLSGSSNVAFGAGIGRVVSSGSENSFVGDSSGVAVTTGSNNSIFGATAAATLTTGSNNVLLGFAANVDNAACAGAIAIGRAATTTISTGTGSGDNGPGIAIGSSGYPVGFRGDGTIYPGNLWRVYINGVFYMIPLAVDGSTSLPVANGGLGITTTPTNGQIPIGNGTNYTAATLTAGSGISITNGSGSITVTSTGAGLAWSTDATGTIAADVNNGYICGAAGATTLTLPATAAVGSVVGAEGLGAGGWILTANTGQTIQMGASVTSSGGTLTSAAATDNVYVRCIVADTTWRVQVTNSTGLTIA